MTEQILMVLVAGLALLSAYLATKPPVVKVVEVEVEKPRPKPEGPVNIDRALLWLAKQVEERGGVTLHPQNAYAVAMYGIEVALKEPDESGRYPVQYFDWRKYYADSNNALFDFAQEMEIRSVPLNEIPNN